MEKPRAPGGGEDQTTGEVAEREPTAAGAIAALAAKSRGRGTYAWLDANYDALAPALATRPSWSALAQYLGEHGIVGADGQAPSAITVRGSWQRVHAQRVKAARTAPEKVKAKR